jgi:tRNA splicing ligase
MMTGLGKTDVGCSEENLFKWYLVQHEGLGGEKKAKDKLWRGSMYEYHNNSVALVPLC